jgi:hypothetical protein
VPAVGVEVPAAWAEEPWAAQEGEEEGGGPGGKHTQPARGGGGDGLCGVPRKNG